MSTNMSFEKRNDPSFLKGAHVTFVGHDSLPTAGRLDSREDAARKGLAYYLRVKPDRRRAKAAYPPLLDRRRN